MTVYLYEFLYRGRPPGSAEEPAWHVVLGAVGEDAFGRPVHAEKTLDMAQAAAAGWDLPKIIEAINASALAEAEMLRREIEAKEQALDEERDLRARAQAELAALKGTAAPRGGE